MTLHEGLVNVENALNEGLVQNVANQGLSQGIKTTIKNSINQKAAQQAGKEGPQNFQAIQQAINVAGQQPTVDNVATACMGILNACMNKNFNWQDISSDLAPKKNNQSQQTQTKTQSQSTETNTAGTEQVNESIAAGVGAAAAAVGAGVGAAVKGVSNLLKQKFTKARNALLGTAYSQSDQKGMTKAAKAMIAFLKRNKDQFTNTGLKLGNFSNALQNAANGKFGNAENAVQVISQKANVEPQAVQSIMKAGYTINQK